MIQALEAAEARPTKLKWPIKIHQSVLEGDNYRLKDSSVFKLNDVPVFVRGDLKRTGFNKISSDEEGNKHFTQIIVLYDAKKGLGSEIEEIK